MRTTVFAALLVALPALASAQSWSSYDHTTGNMYSNTRDSMGVTTFGMNSNTGSSWNIRQNNDGNYHGTDSNGNFFSGNHNTGYYNNSNGTTCVGTGYARVCN